VLFLLALDLPIHSTQWAISCHKFLADGQLSDNLLHVSRFSSKIANIETENPNFGKIEKQNLNFEQYNLMSRNFLNCFYGIKSKICSAYRQ